MLFRSVSQSRYNNCIVDRKDWEACVKTNHPDISADNFRFYLNKLLKDGYIEEFPFKEFPKEEQARRNKKVKYYELTRLGMENQPVSGEDENTSWKRPEGYPKGWKKEHETWLSEQPDAISEDSPEYKEWMGRQPADYPKPEEWKEGDW